MITGSAQPARAQATPDRPWLGLAHFTAADRDYFYGRDAEIRELTDRVRRAPLTVLYGLSGYGKSSLLGAGLIPALAEAGHRVTLLRRCYDDLAIRPLTGDVVAAIEADWGQATPTEKTADQSETAPPAPPTLWEYFHDRRRPWLHQPAAAPSEDDLDHTDADSAATPPVLLLDQFEEIFIKGENRSTGDAAADTRARAAARDFLTQLADLVENRPPDALRRQLDSGSAAEKRALLRRYDFQARPVRVAVALRDDFLARFERWRRVMPSMMEHRIELRLLSGPQAYQAVFQPGTKRADQPPIIPAPVAEAVVRAAAGAAPDVPLDEIDAVPPILSLLCERLNDRRLAAATPAHSISERDFSPGEAARILGAFYESSLRPHPRALREFLEDELVSDSGFRENVTLDSALAALRHRAGIADAESRLRQLVDDRILVIEDRGGMPRVEFTHDTLAKLALDRRAERTAKRRRRRALAWSAASLFVAAVSLGLMLWALSERNRAESARQLAEKHRTEADNQKQAARVARERSDLEAGRAWLERAKLAWESKNDPLTALVFAARAVGFHGFGRQLEESPEFEKEFPSLLGAAMMNPPNESDRQREVAAVRIFVDGVKPTLLPCWSSPIQAHHESEVRCVAYSPEGKRVASGAADGTVKLWEAATGKKVSTLAGHSGSVSSVAFSLDGSRVASASADNTVKLWNAASGQEIATLVGHLEGVRSVAFNPDGRRLASGAMDNTVKLWDSTTGKSIATLDGHSSAVLSVAFSPDGTRVASGSWDNTVRIWDVATGKELTTLIGHLEGVWSVAFSPDGKRVASGAWDGTAKLWDTGIGSEVAALTGHSGAILSLAFSPDGRLIASGGEDKMVKLWDVTTGKEVATLIGHSDRVWSLAFSPDGKRLVSAGDKAVKFWDAATGKEIGTPNGHSDEVTSVMFSPDGVRLVSGSEDRMVKLWEAASGQLVSTLTGHSDRVWSVAFSPDGRSIASGAEDKSVKLWDAVTGKEMATLFGHSAGVSSVAFSPDGTLIASGSEDKTVRLWDVGTLKEVASLTGHYQPISSVVFSSDGTLIASASWDRMVKLWDAASGKELASLARHSSAVLSVAFSPDGRSLASGSEDGEVKLWDATNGNEYSTLSGHLGKVWSVAFSPDGTQLASGSEDKAVKLWDTATGKELAALTGHSNRIWSVTFNPDGTRLASAAGDKTVKLWEVGAGRERVLATLKSHSSDVWSVAFSPDGTRVASGSWDRNVKLWDAANEKLLATLAGHSSGILSVAFSADGTRLASGSFDKTMKLWDPATGENLATLKGHSSGVSSVAFSPDGKRLASSSGDYSVRLWDAATGTTLPSLMSHAGDVSCVAFSPDGTRIASGSEDRTVKLWDSTTGKELAALTGHSLGVRSVVFSPDGSRLVSGSWDKTVKLWHVATRKEMTTLTGHTGSVFMVAFSPDGRHIASASEDKTVKLWDSTTGKELATLTGHSLGVRSVAFSPDGKRLVSGSQDNMVKLWDAFIAGGLASSVSQPTPRGILEAGIPMPDLRSLMVNGLLLVRDREVRVPSSTSSLLHSREFRVHHYRADELAALATPGLPPGEAAALRLRLMARTGQWRAARAWWASEGQFSSPSLRADYLVLLLTSAADAKATLVAGSRAELMAEVAGTLTSESSANPRVSLALGQHLLNSIDPEICPDPVWEVFFSTVTNLTPRAWCEGVGSRLEHVRQSKDTPESQRQRLVAVLRRFAARHPTSPELLRDVIATRGAADPERVVEENRLLALDGAEANDFANAASQAAQRGEAARAKAILTQGEARFPDDESVHHMAGWIYLKLEDPSAALAAFERARGTLTVGEEPGTYLLAGIASSQWMADGRDAAVVTYKELVETGRSAENPIDWADPETIAKQSGLEAEARQALEAVRVETLRRHPELAPAAPEAVGEQVPQERGEEPGDKNADEPVPVSPSEGPNRAQ